MACEPPKRRHHALAVPLPAQGHVNPMMRLCKRLAAQEGFTITFLDITNTVSTSQQPPPPSKQHKAVADAGGRQLDIRRTHMSMPLFDPTPTGASIMECFFEAIDSLAPQIQQLLLQPRDPPITCLISDIFMTTATQSVADKLNLPRIALYPSSHSALLLGHHIQQGTVSLEEVLKALEARECLKNNTFKEGLLGLPTIRVGDLVDHMGENHYIYIYKLKALQQTVSKAHAIVVNTFKEIEEGALDVNVGIPVYGIGPLVEPLEKEISTSFWKEDEGCMSWLESQPCSSVLFISFGSFASLTIPQFEEIVAGLLSSQQRFLWVFRSNLVKDASYTMFPEELLSKFHGKGYVTHWAPHVKVLSHPSVHGFLTHCGWNSTIEAISQGVPMLCFPYFADQFLDAKFIIEEWKVGLGFKENTKKGLIDREEIERVIRALHEGEEGEHLHKNAKQLKDACSQSYLPKGYAYTNIQAIVKSLK